MTPTLLLDTLRDAAAKHGERTALVHRETRLTYAQLLDRVERARAALQATGVEPGVRVALLAGGVSYVEAFFATIAAGAIAAPVDPRLPPTLVDSIIADLDVDLVLRHDDSMHSLHEQFPHPATHARRVEPHDRPAGAPAAIFQTAGTSGRPLAVVHSQSALARAASAVEQSMRRSLAPSPQFSRTMRTFGLWRHLGPRLVRVAREPVVLLPMALQNISGHTSIMGALTSGARLVLMDAFHPHRTLELVERERVTNLGGTPMILELLLRVKTQFDGTSLLLVMSGGELVAPDVLRGLAARFGCAVGTSYGATELAGPVLMTRLNDTDRDRYETVGHPLPGVDVRIDGDDAGPGELLVRVPDPMLGYWRDPEITAAALDGAGWYRTGDLAQIEPGGAVRILGRVNDVVRRADTVVHLAQIERELELLVGAREIALVDAPGPGGETALCAFVVPLAATVDPALVTSGATRLLPAGWTIDRVEQLPRLPRTTDGKVRKETLRSRLGAGRGFANDQEDEWPQP